MICSRCGAAYSTLACPECMERAARQALLKAQPPYLARVLTGQFDLTLAQKGLHKPHVQLFGGDRAFCGYPLKGTPRTTIAYNLFAIDTVCPQCAEVMADLLHTTREAL